MFERMEERLTAVQNIVPESNKGCIWSDTGGRPDTVCGSQSDCTNCLLDIDMRRDTVLTLGEKQSPKVELIGHRFYHHCHTWVQVEEQALVRIGIDDFGQKMLGPIEKIFLPLEEEKTGINCVRIKARGQIIPLTLPVDGYVEEANEDLISQPHLINESPYEKGWLLLLRPTRLVRSLENLFYGPAALQWFDLEMFRLAALITSELNNRVGRKSGMRLPDGSLPDFDVLNELPPCITKKILEQYFLYCHTNDRFKG